MSQSSAAKKVLDHGYLDLVETWGSDYRVIEAARMSTDKGFLGWGASSCAQCGGAGQISLNWTNTVKPTCGTCGGSGKVVGDEKLLRYLWENKHATPFEMAGMVVEVQAPIFVFREWRTHRTASQLDDVEVFPWESSYNEMSARYAPLPDLNYVPTVERLLLNSKTNKQAGTIKGADELSAASAEIFREVLQKSYVEAERIYQSSLSAGVPKELARIHLPVGRYSRMRASANLRNWLAFLTLRMDAHAQWEIRQYANAVGLLIEQAFPRTWELFEEGRK